MDFLLILEKKLPPPPLIAKKKEEEEEEEEKTKIAQTNQGYCTRKETRTPGLEQKTQLRETKIC